jgi:hypothetical protein
MEIGIMTLATDQRHTTPPPPPVTGDGKAPRVIGWRHHIVEE